MAPIDKQDINISEVKDYNLNTSVEKIDTPDIFLNRLNNYNITDLSQVLIKKDGEMFIFNINGNDEFCVFGEKKFQDFVKNFYENKENNEKSIVVELNQLRLSILSGTAPSLREESDRQQELLNNATDINVIKNRITLLHDFYDAQLDDSRWNAFFLNTKYTAQEKASWKINKTEAKKRLKMIENIQDKIEQIEKGEYENKALTPYDKNITLGQFSAELDKLSNDVPAFIANRNDIILGKADTVPYYNIDINTKSEARSLLNAFKKSGRYNAKLNKIELKGAKTQEHDQDLQALEEYLNTIIADPDHFDPSEHPFTAEHQKAFNYLLSIDPTLKTSFENGKKQADTGTTDKNPNTANQQSGTDNKLPEGTPGSVRESFEKQGLNGMVKSLLDKTHMTSDQKNFWGGAANLAMWGGIAFVGWKFISNVFKSLTKTGRAEMKANGGRGWIVAPLAVFFGANAWKGDSPLSLLNGGALTEAISGIFGGINRNTASPDQLAYTEGFAGASALFNGMTYPQVANLIETDADGKMKIKADQYDNFVTALENNPDTKKKAAAKFLRSIGKDDPNGMIDLALTGMGISMDKLQKGTEKDTFNETATQAIGRIGAMTNFMETNNYQTIIPEQMPLIRKYIAEGTPTLQDLEARGDVFQRTLEMPSADIQAKNKAKIEALKLSDKNQEKNLINALNRFYYLQPTAANSGLDIKLNPKNASQILFTTYGKDTIINLNDKTLAGMGGIRFDSYIETMKAANLTNYIKDICKTKVDTSPDKKPFKISQPGGDIEFNDATTRSMSTDTEIISAGIGGNLQKVSPKLEQHKQDYVDYLNSLDFWAKSA